LFEIGNSLREARLRQGFELPRVEADTKIRSKYLRALEDERFEVLPGETYVKGFLRTYAEYLGLDGQLYLDEYNSRFAREEEPAPPASSTRRPRSRRLESNLVFVALAAIVAVTILFVIAWRYGTGQAQPADLLDGRQATQPAQAPTDDPSDTPVTSTEAAPASAPRARARLVLTAVRGDCWLQVRAGSASGELLYEGTLQQGQTQRFTRWTKLWIQFGAPAALNARLNGDRVTSFPDGPSIVVVTPTGVRTLATA
jgi:cytoskeletal protein RodZ